jgi:hypothetical protein
MQPGNGLKIMLVSFAFSLSGVGMKSLTIPLKRRRCRRTRIWHNPSTGRDSNVSRRDNSSVESFEILRLLCSYASWCGMRLR